MSLFEKLDFEGSDALLGEPKVGAGAFESLLQSATANSAANADA